nr:MAG TPA: hypothetical protein [Caudoviricetes sp.]
MLRSYVTWQGTHPARLTGPCTAPRAVKHKNL